MDVFWVLVFILQFILDTVTGAFLCNSGSTSWIEGISRCLTGSGTPLSSKEIYGISLPSTDQVWTADFFFPVAWSREQNKLCRFNYRNRSGIAISSGVLLCGCSEARNYLCRDNISHSVIVMNGMWTSAMNCGTFNRSDIQNIEWKEGYYWSTDAKFTGILGKVTNRTKNLPVNYFNNSCYRLATTIATTKPPTNTPVTFSFGNPVSTHRETLIPPITAMSQMTEGSSPTGTTAVENAHKDKTKETKHTDIATAAGAGVGVGLALIGAIVALIVFQRRYGCIRCRKSFKDKPITEDKSLYANLAYDVTGDLHITHSKTETKAPSLSETPKYKNVISTKTKEPQDMLSCTQNTEYSFPLDVDGPSKIEGKNGELSHKENKKNAKTGIKTSEYIFALDVDGPNKTDSKVEEDSYKENEYDTTQHVRKAPPTDENLYNMTYASDLEKNLYNKTNRVCVRENVYSKTDTADIGESVYNKTFDRTVQKVPVTNEYGSPMTKVNEEFDSTSAAQIVNNHADNIYNQCN